jgi:hypothetical protein
VADLTYLSKGAAEVMKVLQCDWWGDMRERNHLEDSGLNERIILRTTFRKWDVCAWNGSI